MKKPIALLAAALCLAPLVALADSPTTSTKPAESRPATKPDTQPDTKPSEPKSPDVRVLPGDKVSVTEHETTIGGKPIKYRATAGTYDLKEDGKSKADLFFVAYERTPAPATLEAAAARPVTFVFNGGPGAASVWLHLGTAGPARVKLADDVGNAGAPPYRVVDNEFSWLDATDLVFIDPVGTGYSRAAKGEDPRQFYGVEEDLRWVAEFIRLWTTRNGRWPSPKFLAGESYGTTRAAGLSEHLLENQGIALNGIILISSVLDFSTLSFGGTNDVPYVLFLPTYTATAHYHKRLSKELQADLPKTLKAAEAFASGPYAAALAKGSKLSADEKADVAAEVAKFTGLDKNLVLKANLRVDSNLFRKTLLVPADAAGGKFDERIVGRFDARLAGFDPDPVGRNPDHDPSFHQYFVAYSAAFNDFARRTLKFETDTQYDVLSGRVQPWNFGRTGQGFLNVADDLERAMRKSPHTKLLVCSGIYDLATPYLGTSYTLEHLRLSPEVRRNVTETFYEGGHMMYHEAGALKKLKADVAGFVEGAK